MAFTFCDTRLERDFLGDMERGKLAAQGRRNKGLVTGKSAAGWRVRDLTRGMEAGTWEALVYVTRAAWASTVREAQNDFAVACLNGPHEDPRAWEILL